MHHYSIESCSIHYLYCLFRRLFIIKLHEAVPHWCSIVILNHLAIHNLTKSLKCFPQQVLIHFRGKIINSNLKTVLERMSSAQFALVLVIILSSMWFKSLGLSVTTATSTTIDFNTRIFLFIRLCSFDFSRYRLWLIMITIFIFSI